MERIKNTGRNLGAAGPGLPFTPSIKGGTPEDVVFSPLTKTGRGFYIFVGAMLLTISIGLYAYYTQLTNGLIVTGMRNTVSWGVYITDFVFFIGISHAGTLISAILRVTGAEWRKPITRIAEAITVFALMIGAPMVLIDLGRPERLLNMFLYARIQSPLIWDMLSITAYLSGSILYLYLPLIPDMAMCRDRFTDAPWWRRKLYSILSLGWRGNEEQKRLLEKGISIMAILIIPIAISVHTVVSWVFGMTVRAGWHSTIFGPYFVIGAIFSGIASLIIAMGIFRRAYHLEHYLKSIHFKYLGLMLLTLDMAYIYSTISEYLTIFYGSEVWDIMLVEQLTAGRWAFEFWFFVGTLVFPALILAVPKTRTIPGIILAAVLVNIGMWIKRYIIVVPSMALPLYPGIEWGIYTPTWVELAVTAGALGIFALFFGLFSKIFPIISLWEVSEGDHDGPSPTKTGSEQGGEGLQ